MNNLDMMRKRFEWQGGIEQENRMIQDKFRTLQRVLKYSYQACTISIVQTRDQSLFMDEIVSSKPVFHRALINPDKVKQDYDDKIISIPYFDREGNPTVRPGDVFEWCKTDTNWIVYLEEITEDAYFRGEIRRCRYKINFKDEEGNWCSTWAAIRGPVETQIDSIQKNQERIDRPNLTLNILMPQNDQTLHAFDRYQEFLFAGRCWKVQAPDSISMNGIIEVNAREDYINRDTDDMENEMKNGLVIEPENPTPNCGIEGSTFILPKQEEIYTVVEEGGCWKVLEKNTPVTIKASSQNGVTIIWNKTVSGQFTLQWKKGNTTLEKVVVVQSLY